jgi:hypothetical protein
LLLGLWRRLNHLVESLPSCSADSCSISSIASSIMTMQLSLELLTWLSHCQHEQSVSSESFESDWFGRPHFSESRALRTERNLFQHSDVLVLSFRVGPFAVTRENCRNVQ